MTALPRSKWRRIQQLEPIERAILRRIADGKAREKIAAEFRISVEAVERSIARSIAQVSAANEAEIAYLYAQWEVAQTEMLVQTMSAAAIGGVGDITLVLSTTGTLSIGIERTIGSREIFHFSAEDADRFAAFLTDDDA